MYWLVLVLFATANGLGCIDEICKKTPIALRTCNGQQCGGFNDARWDGRLTQAVDVVCEHGRHAVIAPFDGTIKPFQPFGDGSSWDQGLTITGKFDWSMYEADISFMVPTKTSGVVKRGDTIGHTIRKSKLPEAARRQLRQQGSKYNFVQFALRKNGGGYVDPTSRMINCSCTGMICDTNAANRHVGGYKNDDRYGVGFHLGCALKQDVASSKEEDRLPNILSPIDGKRIGRIRSRIQKAEEGYSCEDEGVFVVGSGKWEGYDVRIFNVRYVNGTGERTIKAGDVIAKRLQCANNHIFVEMRHAGKPINFKNQLTGTNCTMPTRSLVANRDKARAAYRRQVIR